MIHPLQWIPEEKRIPLFRILLALTLVLLLVFQALDSPLKTPVSPAGIVSFELAGSAVTAASIVSAWDSLARIYAAFGLGIDYLFMVSYALTFALAALLVGEKHGGKFAAFAPRVAWAAFAAAGFDAVENIALWRILTGKATAVCAALAAFCASLKFTLILLALIFVPVGWLRKARG